MTRRLLVIGIILALTNVSSPGFAVGPSSEGDPVVSCRDGSKVVSEDRHALFADENLELLALRFSTGFYADPVVYRRLQRDIESIRTINSKMRSIHYFKPNDGRTLLLFFDPKALTQAKSHQYDHWNCLNSYFGATVTDYSRFGYIEIRLRGPYKLENVAELYKRLPGVSQVDTSHTVGDGSTIYVTRRDTDWVYIFDIAGGDCPAGCTEHELHYFKVCPDGKAREIAMCAHGCEPPPDWVKLYFRQYR
jgi:hypothetical protein